MFPVVPRPQLPNISRLRFSLRLDDLRFRDYRWASGIWRYHNISELHPLLLPDLADIRGRLCTSSLQQWLGLPGDTRNVIVTLARPRVLDLC